MSWVPTTDFENEVVSMEPYHDFIYGSLTDAKDDSDDDNYFPRPESHIRFAVEKKKMHKQQCELIGSSNSRKLDIIAKVQRIAGTKTLGEQPTLEDWDDDTNVERETIAMMRHLGLQPNIEEALDEKCTMATLPLSEEMLVMHNGSKRMPIFYNDKYFKLKPRVPMQCDTAEIEADETTDANQATVAQGSVEESESLPTFSEDKKLNNTTATDNVLTAAVDESSSVTRKSLNADEEAVKSCKSASSNDHVPTCSWRRSANSSLNSSIPDEEAVKSFKFASSDDHFPPLSWRRSANSSLNSSIASNRSSTCSSTNGAQSNWRQRPAERFYTAKQLYSKNRKK